MVIQHNSPLLPDRAALLYTVLTAAHTHTPGDRGAIGIGDLLETEHRGRSVDVHVRGGVRASAYGGINIMLVFNLL